MRRSSTTSSSTRLVPGQPHAVEGNSGTNSGFTVKTDRTLNSTDAVYSPFPE
jgi:hypothetical protein